MSDDYTPTTGEVRAVYASASFVKTAFNKYDSNAERGLAEFDRWLAQHDRQKFYGYAKTPSVQKVAAAISGQCGHKWEDIPPMSANAYLRMAQSVLDLMEEEPGE
jgi:hypothetical protein